MLEKIVEYFAPTRCIGCQKTGSVLCEACLGYVHAPISRCYKCHKTTSQFQVCSSCRKKVKLKHVWVVSDFSETSKQLIYLFKFERLSSASKVLGQEMADILPILPDDTIICHVPTAPTRIRIRGYDQANLLAKEIARIKNLKKCNLLSRTSNLRQLGSSRTNRYLNAKKSYELSKADKIKGKSVLLIDDVTTSGATLETIAELLKNAGAKNVDAVVYAQAID